MKKTLICINLFATVKYTFIYQINLSELSLKPKFIRQFQVNEKTSTARNSS